jgi:O-antigen/teichoic acid export membrane protein
MKQIAKEIISTFSYKLVIAVVTFTASVFISRTLGPELQGKYSLIILFVTMIFNLGNMGIGVAANYFPAKKGCNLKIILNNLLFVSIILSVVIFSAAVLIRATTRKYFLPDIADGIIYLALLAIPIRMIQLVLESFLLGLKNYKFYNIVFLIKISLKLIFTIIFYFSIKNLLLAYVSAYIISQFLVFPILDKKIKKITEITPLKFINYSVIKKILRFGIMNHLSNLIMLLEFKIDIFLINFFSNPLNVGYYYISVIVSEISSVFSSAVNLVLFPKIAELNNKKKIEKIKNFGIFSSLFFSFCFSLLIFFLASPFIKLFFGQAFAPAIPTLKIMAFVTFFSNIKKIILSNLSAQNLIHLANPINILTLILNIALNIYLIPRYGIIGAAYASLTSYAVSVLSLWLRYRMYLKNNH